MLRLPLIIAAAALCLAAAPAKKPAVTPAPKAATAKPAAAGSYDAQSPQSLIGLLAEAGAQAKVARREADAVFVTVASAAANFSVQFAGCDPQGRRCQAALFDGAEEGVPTLAQINGFNQTSLTCRIYLDRASKAHVVYSAILLRSDSRQSAQLHLAAWQGCIADGRAFLHDPAGYLASAA